MLNISSYMSCYKVCVHNRDTNIATAIRSETQTKLELLLMLTDVWFFIYIYIYIVCVVLDKEMGETKLNHVMRVDVA